MTRELSLLRQQTASAASTTSSASIGVSDSTDHLSSQPASANTHSLSASGHRSSSSLSSRSAHAGSLGTSDNALAATPMSASAAATVNASSGIAPPRETRVPYTSSRDQLSRQSSVASRRSEASSPSLSSSLVQGDHFPNLYARRHSGSMSQAHLTTMSGNLRGQQVSAPLRHEEASQARLELESVRRENEDLKQRIRELERALRHRQAGPVHQRSASVSTNSSLPPSISQD